MNRPLRNAAWFGVLILGCLALASCTDDGNGTDGNGNGGDTGGDVDGRSASFGLASPDGDLHIDVWLDEADGSLRYGVGRGGGADNLVILPSRLAVSFDEAEFVDGLTIDPAIQAEPTDRSFELELPRGKRRSIQAMGRERTVIVENGAGDRLAIDLVAFDDGVAHRFRTLVDDPWTLEADRSSFAFDSDGEMFVQLYDRTGLFTPASEGLYSPGRPIDQIYPGFTGWSFPALFHTGDHWTLITETAVGRHDVGHRLVNQPDSADHSLAPPLGNQLEGPAGPAAATPAAAGERALPWKVLITSTDLGDVVSSDVADLLARPSAIDDWSWVRPGRVSWSWWSDSTSPTQPGDLRRFIDLAADLGWEYSLVDANWNQLDPEVLAEVVAYGAERDVGIFLWYNSGGPHNEVPEEPRDRMTDGEVRRAEMARLRELGVAGIKVDFFHGDKASMNALSLDILADAAEAELLVNYHGITSPKGWHVTWPNLLTTEAVRGAEQYKFDPRFPQLAPRHNVVLAFTRNVVGPMDYTPVTVSDAQFTRVTTAAHELALGVVFESGLQHLADTPAAYQGLGPDGLDYLGRLPAVWDDIQLLAGEPGSHVVIARRNGDRWWIGGLNGTDQPLTVEVDLGRLDGVGDLKLAVDGEQRDELVYLDRSDDSFEVDLAPSGGFVAWPSPES